MTASYPILLTAASNTRSLFVLLSLFTLILLGLLIEGLIIGRFTGGSGCSRAKSPVFYYLHVALLAVVIIRICVFLNDLIHAS